MGILVDTSGSMTPKIPQARAAIAEFLHDLNDKDDVFLFAFSSHPFLLQPFTTNHDLVMRRLALLHAYGQTALFDVIMEGLQMVQRGRYDKKALLVVTDGMDNTSALTVNDVVAQARRMGVLVYSIGIGDPNGGTGGVSVSIGPFVLGGDDMEHVRLRDPAHSLDRDRRQNLHHPPGWRRRGPASRVREHQSRAARAIHHRIPRARSQRRRIPQLTGRCSRQNPAPKFACARGIDVGGSGS